jgi:hypothetical protein
VDKSIPPIGRLLISTSCRDLRMSKRKKPSPDWWEDMKRSIERKRRAILDNPSLNWKTGIVNQHHLNIARYRRKREVEESLIFRNRVRFDQHKEWDWNREA